MQRTIRTPPESIASTFGGLLLFFGEVNRLGLATVYSSPSSHLHM